MLAAAGGASLAFWLRPSENAEAHATYFASLNQLLKKAGVDKPTLVIDLDRLDRNIDRACQSIYPYPERVLRLVTKSLPSPGLLRYGAARAKTSAFMAFHRPFLQSLAKDFPASNILLGKPLPVSSVARFYDSVNVEFVAEQQLQWLVDTGQRLSEYLSFARERGLSLQINLELDVGLHRGGFNNEKMLREAFALIQKNKRHLRFSGFMGYDAHLKALPNLLFGAEFARVKQRYNQAITVAAEYFPEMAKEDLCLNGAGSPTFRHYKDNAVINDFAIGSCLVKPKDFDLDSLHDFESAAFIASPILKKQSARGVPALEWLRSVERAWNPNRATTLFGYGGNWLAEVESPVGVKPLGLYNSSNQQGYGSSRQLPLDVGDYIFLRPTQSESVFLQFGDIVAFRDRKIVDYWPVLSQS